MSQPTGTRAMPIHGERTCPNFSPAEPRGVLRYFEDLEQLFDRYGITSEEERKTYAVRYPPTATERAWRCLPQFEDQAVKYADFRAAVLTFYPGTDDNHTWTMSDYDALMGKRARLGPALTYDEYLAHYLEALPISQYLMKNRRITEEQASRLLTVAISQEALRRVEARLEAKFPDTHADVPYEASQVHEAICYVLQRGGRTLVGGPNFHAVAEAQLAPAAAPRYPVIPTPPTTTVVKQEEQAEVFKTILDSLQQINRTLVQQGQNHQSYPPRAPTPPANRGEGPGGARTGCFYCGNERCNTRYCQEIQDDIKAGKIRRNHFGRVVLANGMEVPDVPRGALIRERVNVYYDTQANGSTTQQAAQMVLELAEWEDDRLGDEQLETYELEAAGQGPVTRSHGHQLFNPPSAPRRPPGALETHRAAPSVSPAAGSATTRPSAPNQATHPYAKAVDASNARVNPSATPEKPGLLTVPQAAAGSLRGMETRGREPAYKTTFPELDAEAEGRVVQRVLNGAQSVSMTPMELLSLAPGVRRRVHEITTARRIPTAEVAPPAPKKVAFMVPEASVMSNYTAPCVEEETEQDGVRNAGIANGMGQVFHLAATALSADEGGHGVASFAVEGTQQKGMGQKEAARTVAVESAGEGVLAAPAKLKIRTLWAIIGESMVIECILDGGCQFIAMSEECCLRLKLPYDPNVPLRAIAANGSSDKVLGCARNVPVTIPGGITVYVQVFVIRNASYDVLLGRPFDALLSTRTENLPGEEQVITVKCPNTGTTVTIPTYARGEHPAPSPAQIMGFHE